MKLFVFFAFCIALALTATVPESPSENESAAFRLHYFVVNDENPKIVKFLKEGANMVIKYIDEHTPIRVATDGHIHTTTAPGSTTTEQYLDINSSDSQGYTPLFIAVIYNDGRSNIVDILLKMGADPNIQQAETGKTPLHFAVESGFEEVVDTLINHHANVNIEDKNGVSPLDIALKKGYKMIAAILIESGAYVAQNTTKSKLAVIGCVVQNASARITNALTRNGVHVESDWKNALKEAIKKDDVLSTELLVKNCVEDLKEMREPWPLHLAAHGGHVNVVLALIQNGANVNAVDDYGNTALHWSAYSGQPAVAKTLLDSGAEIDAKDKRGYTSLILAAHEGKADFIQILIENGADVNATNNIGNSALIMAAYYGYEDVVKKLIDNNADTDIKNNSGATARSFAESRGHTSILKMLKSK